MDRDDRERPESPAPAGEPAGAEDAEVKPPVEDEVDEASDQSFPASDPPAY